MLLPWEILVLSGSQECLKSMNAVLIALYNYFIYRLIQLKKVKKKGTHI